MRTITFFSLLLFAGICTAPAQTDPSGLIGIIAPARVNNEIEGNDSTLVPFGDVDNERGGILGGGRYQQLFLATEFDALPKSGAYLRIFALRTDPCAPFGESTVLQTARIRFSTTPRQAGTLSTNLDENLGQDKRLVFERARESMGPNGGQCAPGKPTIPETFGGNWFFLSNSPPFFYSPAAGNLLLDIEFEQRRIDSATRGAVMDAETSDNDGVSRMYCLDGANGTECHADTTGLVTAFWWIVPRISVSRTNDSLFLQWAGRFYLPTFVLQAADRLDSPAAWADYKGEIDSTFDDLYRATIPISAMTRARYFRLFSDTPVPPQ